MVDFDLLRRKHHIKNVYTDGGCVYKNPSPYGITWAYVMTDENDEQLFEDSGIVTCQKDRVLSNNVAEQVAIVKALEFLPYQWSGTLYSDSQIALGRSFLGWKWTNMPRNVIDRHFEAIKKLGEIQPVLLQGHPTKADLECGIGAKRGFPVSKHNVRCDFLCSKLTKEYLNQYPDIKPNEAKLKFLRKNIEQSIERNIINISSKNEHDTSSSFG